MTLFNVEKLFMDKTHADVTFEVDGEEIPGHRLILGQICSYFEKLLYGDFEESKSKRVQITGTSAKLFKEVIRFSYSGQVEIDKWKIDELLALLSMAHEYQFLPLYSAVMKVLEQQSLDFDSYISVASAASLYESNTLKAMCDSFVSMKIDDFLCYKDLEKFTAEFICSMFDSPMISTCDQDKLLGAICKWQQNNSVKKIASVFPKISWEKVSPRITAMMAKEYVSVVQNVDNRNFWKQVATEIEESPKCTAGIATGMKARSEYVALVDNLVLNNQEFEFSSEICEGTLYCCILLNSLMLWFRKDESDFEIPVRRIEFQSSIYLKIERIYGNNSDNEEISMVFAEETLNNNLFKYSGTFSDVTPIEEIFIVSESFKHICEIKLQNIVIY